MREKTKTKDRAAADVGAARPGGCRPNARSNSVEYVNIGLMVLALVVAAVVPFELFLISYAVLGPLHYLTEISWLHDRKFFTPRKADWAPLAVCGLLATLGNDSVLGEHGTRWLDGIPLGDSSLYRVLHAHYRDVMFFAFGSALVFVVTRQTTLRLFGLGVVGVCVFLFHAGAPMSMAGLYDKLFGVYLPTLIHVFIFTGAFILAGALKRNSMAGFLSFAVFLACGAVAIWLPNLSGTPRHGGARGLLAGIPGAFPEQPERPPAAADGVAPWHECIYQRDCPAAGSLSRVRLHVPLSELVLQDFDHWVARRAARPPGGHRRDLGCFHGGIYAVSYDLGLRWLFLLSLTHVLLEFPLNFKCFLEIGTALRRRLVPA